MRSNLEIHPSLLLAAFIFRFRRRAALWLTAMLAATLLSSCGGGGGSNTPAASGAASRIACVGDSITYGAGLDENQAYPAQLDERLGNGHAVGNFGLPGATLLEQGDLPYRQSGDFSKAVRFAPDTVVIALGTNDSKPQNWLHKDRFLSDAVDLINYFKQRPTVRRVFVCLPPPAFSNGAFGIQRDILRSEVTPLLQQAAQSTGATIIDLYTPLQDRPDLFLDGIHPTQAGSAVIAQTVYAAVSVTTARSTAP